MITLEDIPISRYLAGLDGFENQEAQDEEEKEQDSYELMESFLFQHNT